MSPNVAISAETQRHLSACQYRHTVSMTQNTTLETMEEWTKVSPPAQQQFPLPPLCLYPLLLLVPSYSSSLCVNLVCFVILQQAGRQAVYLPPLVFILSLTFLTFRSHIYPSVLFGVAREYLTFSHIQCHKTKYILENMTCRQKGKIQVCY